MLNKNIKHLFLSAFRKLEHVKSVVELFHMQNTTACTLKVGLALQEVTETISFDPRITYMDVTREPFQPIAVSSRWPSTFHMHAPFTIIVALTVLVLALLSGYLMQTLLGL